MTEATTISIPQPHEYAKMIEEGVNRLTRISMEREALKDIIDSISETFDIPKKEVRKVIKTAYDADFESKKEENSTFEALYETYENGKKS